MMFLGGPLDVARPDLPMHPADRGETQDADRETGDDVRQVMDADGHASERDEHGDEDREGAGAAVRV